MEEKQKEEQKPAVLKVHSISIGATTKPKQEKDHGAVDK